MRKALNDTIIMGVVFGAPITITALTKPINFTDAALTYGICLVMMAGFSCLVLAIAGVVVMDYEEKANRRVIEDNNEREKNDETTNV